MKKFTEIAKKKIGREWGNRLEVIDKERNELQCSKKLRTGVGKHVWRVRKCRIDILHGRSAGLMDKDADDFNKLL